MSWPADPNAKTNAEPWRVDHTELERLRWHVLLRGLAYTVVTGAILAVLAVLFIKETSQAVDAVRNAQGQNETVVVADITAVQPELVAYSAGIGLFGLVVAVFGVWFLVRILGPERRPPRAALLGLLMLTAPFFMAVAWLVLGAFKGSFLALAGGPLVAITLWVIPVEMLMLIVGQLSIAIKFARPRQVFVGTNELSSDSIAYFNAVEPDMLEAGLDPIGDILYENSNGRCRRLWANPNRTFFASASWSPMGQTTLKAVSVSAVLEDGSYLEAANVPNNLFVAPVGYESFFHNEESNSPAEVLTAFSNMLCSLIEENGTMPRQIRDDQHEHFDAYGITWLSHARSKATKPNPISDLLWLADPRRNMPLPPLPGEAWVPEREPSMATLFNS